MTVRLISLRGAARATSPEHALMWLQAACEERGIFRMRRIGLSAGSFARWARVTKRIEERATAAIRAASDPVVIAPALVAALTRQLPAHGITATAEQIRAVAVNAAYAVAEAVKP